MFSTENTWSWVGWGDLEEIMHNYFRPSRYNDNSLLVLRDISKYLLEQGKTALAFDYFFRVAGIAYLRSKLRNKKSIHLEELERVNRFEAAKIILAEVFPDLRLAKNPENAMLYGTYAAEMRNYIDGLIEDEMLREELTIDILENPDDLSRIKSFLQAKHPELDLDKDIAYELLEGIWAEEIDDFIDSLVSETP